MILKQYPEDFFVKEIIDVDISPGRYTIFTLKKIDFTTFEALKRVAQSLHLPLSKFSFAGLKDRHAITEQVCSLDASISKEVLESLNLENIKITFLGQSKKPIHKGQNSGNFFRIVVRGVKNKPKLNNRFVNYFGEQRFSSNNHVIGKYLIKKKFKEACSLLEGFNVDCSDPINAFRSIPKSLSTLFVHAYQSFIWNQSAKLWVSETEENMNLPLVGFGTEEVDKHTKYILDKEGVSLSDFVIRQLPNLSVEGDIRSLYAFADNLRISYENSSAIVEFELKKGSYATVFIQQLFSDVR